MKKAHDRYGSHCYQVNESIASDEDFAAVWLLRFRNDAGSFWKTGQVSGLLIDTFGECLGNVPIVAAQELNNLLQVTEGQWRPGYSSASH